MYIARQPIFNKTKKIYGYELLFRSSSTTSTYDCISPQASTATVLGGLFELGIENIVGKQKAFVNFDYDFLLSKTIELVKPDVLVIEVLENVDPDPRIIQRIKELRQKGYTIALDDFDNKGITAPLKKYANIIKYDIRQTSLLTLKKEVKNDLAHHHILLAEKVESEEEFLLAKEMGFHLFQGFFFQRPQIIAGMKMEKTPKIIFQMIFQELKKEEPSFRKLAEIISHDVNIAYRLMRIKEITHAKERLKTIQSALVRMGLNEFERWVHVLFMQEFKTNKPIELLRLSLVRSKFGELLAKNGPLYQRQHEISLMCLFSVVDALLDQSMESALENVSISEDVKDSLISKKGDLARVLKIIRAYEEAEWSKAQRLAQDLKINDKNLATWYLESLRWADQTVRNF
ncbi:EAL and HDOD domain-containing protein [Lacticigenium naphthae]|uniref:EAL and HDOD domain-containing protein n=1 Tax=Lacticigenium naphthae TaxID=515351 RepID=UPI00146BF0CF|nr:EAL domain-containing protein [Lacticigenium naphthae]